MTRTHHSIAVLCLFLFAILAAIVTYPALGSGSHDLERALLGALRDAAGIPIGPAWFQEAVRDVSALGSMTVSIGATLLAAGYFALRGERRLALFMLAAMAGAILLVSVAKLFFGRPRPDLFEHGTRVFTLSFPSAHATVSATAAAAFATALAGRFADQARRAAVYAACAAVALLIGASRVYLGVHWPTDVVAGWALGLAWTLFCVPIARSAPGR